MLCKAFSRHFALSVVFVYILTHPTSSRLREGPKSIVIKVSFRYYADSKEIEKGVLVGVIIKNGILVDEVMIQRADLRIEEGRIHSISAEIHPTKEDEIIDASGKYVFPGAIDSHTHLDMPFGEVKTSDDFFSGTQAAIFGGTTSIVDFAIQSKGESLKTALNNWKKRAEKKSFCDYGFHVAITDCNQNVLNELETVPQLEGVSSLKLFLAYKGLFQVDDGVLYKVLKKSKKGKYLVALHCENGDIIDRLSKEAVENGKVSPKFHALTRPDFVEAESISRAAHIAKFVNAELLIVHLSSAKGLVAALEGRKKGVKIFIETCPQYLLLDDSLYEKENFEGAKYVMSPPLRKSFDNEYLWRALSSNKIDFIGTDHCAFNFEDMKKRGINDFKNIPNGAPGIETRFSLLYTYGVAKGKISLNQFVSLLSTNAAKTLGMYPQKGNLSIGSDADIVVFDPNKEGKITHSMLHEQVDYTSYEGFDKIGEITDVMVRGISYIRNSKWSEKSPKGQYIFRKIKEKK